MGMPVGPLSARMDAHRQVVRRDARKEGEPDDEPSAPVLSDDEQAMKDTQRDLTSLSGPIPRARGHDDADEDAR